MFPSHDRLAGYLETKHGAFVVTNGRTSDIALAYEDNPIVVFDFSRTQEERVNYNVIECFCNGRIFSSKYESQVRRFKRPQILCLSNFYPDKSKLSDDRWQILEFNKQPDPAPLVFDETDSYEPPRKKARLARMNCQTNCPVCGATNRDCNCNA